MVWAYYTIIEEYPEKIIVLPQVVGIKFTTLVVIGSDSVGRCKSNYHKIITMEAPTPW
jgi:hypothetical protein